MNRFFQIKQCFYLAIRSFVFKLVSLLICMMFVIGSVTATNSSDGGIKVPNFWTAAKDFWHFLIHPDEVKSEEPKPDIETQDKQLVDIISEEIDVTKEADELGLSQLINNPVCKSVYVAESLPNFNKEAIDKCTALIEQQNIDELLKHYVVELCQTITPSRLPKDQIAEIQLRLRKYSLTFPQSNFTVERKDIDGIYGSKTCEKVAQYQIEVKYDVIDGIPDESFYEQISNTIPLSPDEAEELSSIRQKPVKQITPKQKPLENKQSANPMSRGIADHHPDKKLKIPGNPFKKVIFCMKRPNIKSCQSDRDALAIVNIEAN